MDANFKLLTVSTSIETNENLVPLKVVDCKVQFNPEDALNFMAMHGKHALLQQLEQELDNQAARWNALGIN